MAPRKTTPKTNVTEETTPVIVTGEAAAAAPAPTLTPEQEAKIAERKAKREQKRAEEEAAGLILRREYTTADGATFKTKGAAAAHIATLKFRETIESFPLLHSSGYATDPVTITDWLQANREAITAYLRKVKV
jgi:hypothetical protein